MLAPCLAPRREREADPAHPTRSVPSADAQERGSGGSTAELPVCPVAESGKPASWRRFVVCLPPTPPRASEAAPHRGSSDRRSSHRCSALPDRRTSPTPAPAPRSDRAPHRPTSADGARPDRRQRAGARTHPRGHRARDPPGPAHRAVSHRPRHPTAPRPLEEARARAPMRGSTPLWRGPRPRGWPPRPPPGAAPVRRRRVAGPADHRVDDDDVVAAAHDADHGRCERHHRVARRD